MSANSDIVPTPICSNRVPTKTQSPSLLSVCISASISIRPSKNWSIVKRCYLFLNQCSCSNANACKERKKIDILFRLSFVTLDSDF